MMLRLAKLVLVAAIAFFYTIVVSNNLTDYRSNYEFVHHVLLMDDTFPGAWRAIHSVLDYKLFYDGIIVWEIVTMLLCWAGAIQLLRVAQAGRRLPPDKACRDRGADFEPAHVAGCISKCGSRIVPYVAVQGLERAAVTIAGDWLRNAVYNVPRPLPSPAAEYRLTKAAFPVACAYA